MEMVSEGRNDVFTFIFAEQSVIDKNADETVTDGFVHEG